MTSSNKKNFSNISYSIKIGSSTYYVLGCRTKNSKYNNTYFLAEKETIRSKSVRPSTHIQRSQSERRSKTSHHHHRVTFATDVISKQELQKYQSVYNHRYVQSKSKNIKQINRKIMKNKREILTDSFQQKLSKEKSDSVTSIQNEEQQQSVKTNEIIRLFDEQKRSFIQLFEQQINTISFLSSETIKQIVFETLKSQQQISTNELEHTLIQTIQQELQKTLPKNVDKPQSTSLDIHTINQLQDIIIQTIEKYINSIIKDNNNILNHLFAEQKQILIETLTQQPISYIDIIKQALTDALSEYNSLSVTTNTTTNIPSTRQLSTEIKITADIKQTRIDAAFRQQRDTIVANRYLRDSVRQWSNIRSILSLIQKIQECSTNDMENAWLIFCWIGQNIRYDFNCQNNSIECVFQNRISSSYGFVNLYHECCSLLNIQCLQIKGYIKQENKNLKPLAHIWNAIILDQYTYLIDLTWGAGGENNNNTNEFQDFYFLISPEEFIYTHYSKDYQLLQPKITKQDFLNLPIIKSNYYRLNFNLLSPKQGFNQINENIFKISLKIPAYVDLIASLQINNIEYPPHLHTLCQRDLIQTDIINCFLALPTNGSYEIIIYAKTHDEIKYQETISMHLNVLNICQPITFPIRSRFFTEYKCILIEPFRRLVQENEHICIHMKIPNAYMIKIKNGDEFLLVNIDEYENNILKKEIIVQGDIRVCVRWNNKTEKFSTICVFHMI